MMERRLCKDVGRLPFLQSSNLMLEVLEGRQDDLDFSDFFRGKNKVNYIYYQNYKNYKN